MREDVGAFQHWIGRSNSPDPSRMTQHAKRILSFALLIRPTPRIVPEEPSRSVLQPAPCHESPAVIPGTERNLPRAARFERPVAANPGGSLLSRTNSSMRPSRTWRRSLTLLRTHFRTLPCVLVFLISIPSSAQEHHLL